MSQNNHKEVETNNISTIEVTEITRYDLNLL